jgi:hypothetical protein
VSALDRPLTRWDRACLLALLVAFGAELVNVQIRSTRLSRPMTDLGVYTTAAWAVRAGVDPYDVTDQNGWHYVYPPLLAILMAPLATAPTGGEALLAVPFPVTVALWGLFSVLCALLAVHWLASALEATSPDPAVRCQPRGCRRWWRLRALPLLICLPPIMGNLVHGQVNLLLLLLLSGMIAAILRGKDARAGLFLSGAICLKVFPCFLIGYIVWRRRWRCLAGCAGGLCLGLAVIPSAVVGPRSALAYHTKLVQVVLLPGLGQGTDRSRAEELTDIVTTDSQSLVAVAHNALYLDRATRPLTISSGVRSTATVIGLALVGLTIAVAGGRRAEPPRRDILAWGALCVNMLLLVPVCHLPYYCLLVPLILGLVDRLLLPAHASITAHGWRREPQQGRVLALLSGLFAFNFLARLLVHVPGLHILRDVGLSMLAAVPVWLLALVMLWRSRGAARVSGDVSEPPRKLAA